MATLSEEEDNYVRMSLLLTGMSPRAVRSKFDKEFAPAVLTSTIHKEHKKLFDLKGKRVINQAQWNVLHPKNGVVPNSKNFDVTLMVCLIRNLTTITPPACGYDCLPQPGEKTDGADIARIKHYRNFLAHLEQTKIDTPYFTSAWSDVADAVGRLGGPSMVNECQELKVKILDQSNKEIMIEIKLSQAEMKELQQSFQNIVSEFESHKASHRDLKISYDNLKSDHEETTKEIEDLTKSYSSLRTDRDEKTKEVENLGKSYNSLKTDNEILANSYNENRKKLEKLMAAHEDPVPPRIREKNNRDLKTWQKDDEMFMETRVATHILECVKINPCVTVTGSSGMGKTFTVRHVALQMASDGYDILPVRNPDDIDKYYVPKKKAIFIIDDFCGTYILNQYMLNRWKSLSDTISDILEENETKIIVSCRSQVYQDDLFKIFTLFRSCECNMMSKDICLLLTERQSLAELYLKTDACKINQFLELYDCFPLLCKLYSDNSNFNATVFFENPFMVYEEEVSKLWTEGAYGKYCALLLCVMFNNHLKEEWLTEDIDIDIKTVIENTCEACKLERGTSRLVLRDELDSLTSTFLRKDTFDVLQDDTVNEFFDAFFRDELDQTSFYRTLRNQLFDYLVSYFGKVMIQNLIKNANRRFISERLLFERQNDSDQFTIIIPDKYKQMYLQRMTDDWSRGYVSDVFRNNNMQIPKFRVIFLKHLLGLDPLIQIALALKCDVSYNTTERSYHNNLLKTYENTSPLVYCCLLEDINIVQWLCDHGCDVNHCNRKGQSPLHIACMQVNVKVVSTLIHNKADINMCTHMGETPLYVAFGVGHTKIVTELLNNNAAINTCTHLGASPLYKACEGGHTEIVSILIDYKADINKYIYIAGSPLYVACCGGYIEIVTKLIDNKADVNVGNIFAGSPLYAACRGGYIAVVSKLLDNNADINSRTLKEGSTPLYISCREGHTKVVTKLLKYKVDIDQCAARDDTPLCVACHMGYTDVVDLLLANNADVNKCTRVGESPLFIACKRKHTEIVSKLLANKADVNKCTRVGESPLFIACKRKHTEIVSKLLANKADVNKCTFKEKSPLHIACEKGYTEIVSELIENEADVNMCSNKVEPPLHIACKRGHIAVVTKLLDSKADVNNCTKYQLSSLYISCKIGYTEVVSKLLANKADVNLCTEWRASPLYIACKEGHAYIVNMLLKNKADINKCTDRGESPVYIACKGRHSKVINMLLDNQADLNGCTHWGGSPLYITCSRGYTEVVTLLLDNNADINKYTKRGESPLYIACKGGHIEVVNLLLDNKADINKCTMSGKSPLYIACAGEYAEVATKLLQNNADVIENSHWGAPPLYIAYQQQNKKTGQ